MNQKKTFTCKHCGQSGFKQWELATHVRTACPKKPKVDKKKHGRRKGKPSTDAQFGFKFCPCCGTNIQLVASAIAAAKGVQHG